MDIPPDNIFMHEAYDNDTVENDIALMKLPVAIALPRKPTDNCKFALKNYLYITINSADILLLLHVAVIKANY